MKETIKDIEVIAYKGMNSDMTCRDFKYELGKSYKTDKAKRCICGFHACLNPIDVLDYYQRCKSSRYFKVKLFGEITKCSSYDTKVAATEITILEEITDTFNEVIKTEWLKNENVIDLLYYSDGLARIKNCESKYNFIDKKGKLLSEKWFDWGDYFHDGFARVQKEDRLYNFINKYGKLLSEQWFELVGDFHDGFAVVKRAYEKYNYIDTKGKLISNEWFKYVDVFNDGFAKMKRTNGEWVKIDKTGNLIKNLQ